jgi:hypothetical protein
VAARTTGEAGELLVLAEPYRRDVLGAQAARGTRGIDLLTSTGKNLQVKSKRGKGRWMIGREGERPAADVAVLVSVGKDHADDEFFIVPVDLQYDWVGNRHRAYWATRGDAGTGERNAMQIRDSDGDVRDFLSPYRDAWENPKRS